MILRLSLCVGLFILSSFSAFCQQTFTQEGMASYYADKFEGRPTASGEKYKHNKLTAAHKTLPFGTVIKVTNLKNGKSVTVKVNDRGPFVEGRIVDLSKSAAEQLDFIIDGLTRVKVEIVEDMKSKETKYDPGNPAQVNPNVEEKEFYEFSVNRIRPNGYGVQIGSYQEMANLVRVSDNLRKSYRKKVTVQVSVINGIKIYKIIIGAEKSRSKAEALKARLAKRYPDCFIVDFNNL